MENENKDKASSASNTQNNPDKPTRDIPHLIKWILLILLLLLLAAELSAGEFSKLADSWLAWFILIIKLVLISGLIILMRVQHSIKCNILSPTGCTPETPDTTNGILTIDVTGTAIGGAFSYYTLEIRKDGDPPIADIISYPGGGANGSSPVNNGLLGTFNTTLLLDGAYTITLRVYPIGGGSPCVRSVTFNLLKIAVWISNVAGSNPLTNFLDESSELGSGSSIHSFGGPLHINGSAYVYECANRKVKSVEMRYAPIASPGAAPAQPSTDSAVPSSWPLTNQLYPPLVYSDSPPPTKYTPCTRIGIRPSRLLNKWGTCDIFGTTYSTLVPVSWQSRNITDSTSSPMGGGKFSLLLIVEDTAAHRYFDVQKIWIDNWPVVAKIVKFQMPGETAGTWTDIPVCTDILLSWKKLRIIGLAWDALIDPAFPVTGPNDNFDSYSLAYSKQFIGGWESITVSTPTQRVPNTLAPSPGPLVSDTDADVLAEWDLTTLDAGHAPESEPPCGTPPSGSHKLYRGCECTYQLKLAVSDTTITQSTSEHHKHHPVRYEAIKVINDLS